MTSPLRAVTTGRGHPLLLLTGFGVSPRAYAAVTERLAARYRVVVPWLEGPTQWSLDGLLDAVDVTVDAHADGPARVVGHSFGGAIALALVGRSTSSYAGLVVANSLGYSPGPLRMALLGLHPHNTRLLAYPPALVDIATAVVRRPRELAAAGWWAFRCDLQDDMRRIKASAMPRAVLWSDGDALLPPWLGQRLATALGAPFIELGASRLGRRTGHEWPMRRPDVFAELVGDALG